MATLAYHIFKKQISYDGGETWQDTVPLETIKMPVTGVTCEVPWTARVVASLTEYVVSDVCELEQGYAHEIRSGCSHVHYANPTDYYHNLCDGDIITSADTTAVNTLFSKAHSQDLAERFSFSKLILKDNIKTIDDYAFDGNYISDIVFSGTSQLETIGDYAFHFYYVGDANQICPKEFEIEEIGTFTIGSKRTFNMPNSLKTIGDDAFYFYCNVNYFFPDDFVFGVNSLIENIGNRAFEKTNGVRIFFNMPTPPSNVSNTIFSSRPAVIIVPNQYVSSYRTALSGLSQYICSTTALGNAGKVEYGDGYNGGVITIPCDSTSSVTFSDEGTPNYYNSHWLKVGDCVETISGNLNPELLYINLGNSLKHIGNNMFSGQTLIDEITLPETLRTIGNSAFTECYRLKNVVIPSGVTSIGASAFSNCSSLRNITVGGGDIGDGAFSFTYSNNSTAYDSINLLEGVTSIGVSAFTNVDLHMTDLIIPDSVTSIGEDAFYSSEYGGGCSAITGITIGSGITSIGDGALYYNRYVGAPYRTFTLRGTSQLKTIGSSVFCDSNGIVDLYLPNVEIIGNASFDNCVSLRSIHIGNKIQRIGGNAFSGCTSLTAITIDSTSPDSINLYWGALDGTSCPIYVPCDSFLDYKNSSTWQRYNVRIMPKPECPEIEYKVIGVNRSGSTYSIVCNGDSTLNWNEFQYIAPVTAQIGNCVRKLGDECLYGGTDLTTVTTPDTLTEIGSSAFTYCSKLGSVNIPSGVTRIGTRAFQGCTSLSSITIPESVVSMGDYIFTGCYMTRANFVNNSEYDEASYNYWGCTIVNYDINGVLMNGSTVIKGRKNIVDAIIPESATTISASAFLSCHSLTSVTIPSGVTSIGNYAFNDCSGLTRITVEATTPPTLANANAFSNTNNCPIIVPEESLFLYKDASGWSGLSSRIYPSIPPAPPEPISNKYLTFKFIEDGDFGFSGTSWEEKTKTGTTYYNNKISYSTDNGLTWTQIGNSHTYITVHSGDTVMFKGNCIPHYGDGIGCFNTSGKFNVEGNIMSLLYGDNYSGKVDLSGTWHAFINLLKNTDVVNAGKMSLPATTLSNYCYSSMFSNCRYLTVAPELPAATLAEYCYGWMISSRSLMVVSCMATDMSAQSCLYNWIDNEYLGTYGTFYKKAGSVWPEGKIPSGWTIVEVP